MHRTGYVTRAYTLECTTILPRMHHHSSATCTSFVPYHTSPPPSSSSATTAHHLLHLPPPPHPSTSFIFVPDDPSQCHFAALKSPRYFLSTSAFNSHTLHYCFPNFRSKTSTHLRMIYTPRWECPTPKHPRMRGNFVMLYEIYANYLSFGWMD